MKYIPSKQFKTGARIAAKGADESLEVWRFETRSRRCVWAKVLSCRSHDSTSPVQLDPATWHEYRALIGRAWWRHGNTRAPLVLPSGVGELLVELGSDWSRNPGLSKKEDVITNIRCLGDLYSWHPTRSGPNRFRVVFKKIWCQQKGWFAKLNGESTRYHIRYHIRRYWWTGIQKC